MLHRICLYIILIFLATSLHAQKKGLLLEIQGAISPATQDYLERSIKDSQKENTQFIILQLNTPGGLETAMRGMTEAIIASPIPIITYVAPAGARAASAGVFIVYASHLAFMAPGTNIGAASPVSITTQTKESEKITTEEKKAMNDAAAYIRGLAQLRDRNVAWAEKAVRQAASISASEAKELKVIDDVVEDYPVLLKTLDGREVKLKNQSITLDTKDLTLEKKVQDWRYQFLNFITNPNIAYLLMLAAAYGIFFELANPGLILPGVVGVISLLLALYAFQLMQINYAGLALIAFGILFIILELFIPSYGILGIGGFIAFVIGSIMLFDVGGLDYRVILPFIITLSILTGLFFYLLLRLAIKSHKKPVISGIEGLKGQEGIVLSVSHEGLTVSVLGEIWQAKSISPLKVHQKIKVISVKGLLLTVEPINGK